MIILQNIGLIVLGAAMVLYGADRLTEGATSIARRFHIREIVIGLTVVAFGTSMPEFVISLMSALKGSSDLAIGNVVGSNIFNTLLIVGVAAMVTPITIRKDTVRKDLPVGILASLLLIVLCFIQFPKGYNGISRIDGIILLLAFVIFMWLTLRGAKNVEGENPESKIEDSESKASSLIKAIFWFLFGLALLIWGSDIFVDAAVNVAKSLNVSESVIGLTIVAFGTSLPELATSVVAAKKGSSEMAIGNVIGSNVFNILWILGCTAAICPMEIHGISIIDLSVMFLGMVILWLFSYTRYKVERWEGLVLTLIFLAYMFFLLKTA